MAKKSCPDHENPAGDGLFPEDVVFEILLRLPVKSICRFRCVSPRWRTIISDQVFVSSHLARSSAHPIRLLGVFVSSAVDSGELKTFLSVEYPIESSDELNVRYYGQLPSMGHSVSQSVCGLICFDSSNGIHVCNPSTGDYITLRSPLGDRGTSFLGYDPIEKKHKILCSINSGNSVLTLGEKEWRKMECVVDLDFEDAMCIDGVIHILGFENDSKPHLILFDVRLETCRVFPFPPDFEYQGHCYFVEVGGNSGLLQVIDSNTDGEPDYELMVLEDPDKKVWSCKKFVLPSSLQEELCSGASLYGVGGMTRGGVLVFWSLNSEGESYMYIFNLEDANHRKIKATKLHQYFPGGKWREDIAVAYHVENLQSLQGLRID